MLASAGAFFAAPALAGSGPDYEVPLTATPPTIDGRQGTFEWQGAVTFGVTFGGLTGTAFVLRTATDLYIALRVSDPTGGPGVSSVDFDNDDNFEFTQGEDGMSVGLDQPQADLYVTTAGLANDTSDPLRPGTNDVEARALRNADAGYFAEFRKPLCSADTAHDICFVPPSGAGSQSRLGFATLYNGVDPYDGASRWPNLTITAAPDTTPPPAPHPFFGDHTSSFLQFIDDGASYIAWYRPGVDGSFTVGVPANDDPESGIASATFPSSDALGWTETPGPSDREKTYSWTASPETRSAGDVISTNGAGLTSPPRRLNFVEDSTAPAGSLTCVPSNCTNNSGPVLVTVSAGDFQSGIGELRYTTDDTDPGPDHGTVIAPGGTFSVTTPDAFVIVWGVDRVGNAGTFAEASVAGAPGPTAQNGNILYQSTRPDPADDLLSHLWEVDPATGAETQLEPPSPALHVAVSNDGTRLAWQATSRNGSFIALGRRDGTNPVAFTGGNDDWPAFSPDGTRVAYAHLEASGVHDIYIKPTDGGDAVNVTSTSETDEIQPSWSPDGTRLLYAAKENPGDWNVVVQDASAGADKLNLTADSLADDDDPAWSPDGTQIAFDSNSGHTWRQVWVMGPEGQNAHPLTTTYDGFNDVGDQNSDPSWSPDGKELTFVFSPGGTQNFDVFTMNADGSDRARLFTNGTHEGYPAWAPASAADPPQSGPTFTVNTDADHADASGCTIGDCSLREAIDAANVQQGPNTVAFAIPGDGAHTISLGSPLPPLTDPSTTIDGYTQAGASENTLATGDNAVLTVRLDGSLAVGGVDPTAIEIASSDNTIQGLSIGSSLGTGFNKAIKANGPAASDNVIRGNQIGGGNQIDGIDVRGGPSGNRIGGPEPGDRNVISGNGDAGVSITSSGRAGGTATTGNRVEGNLISGNRQGVLVQDGAVGTVVTGNEITGNSANGVAVVSGLDGETLHTGITGNSIHDNGALGIDLGMDGVTANDKGDVDSGPNTLQNFPILGVPIVKGGSMTVAVRLNSLPSTRYLIEAFGNTTCDTSGFGEGQTLLGSTQVTTDRLGTVTVSIPFEIGTTTPGGVTLTATELKNRDTSEFSQCRQPQAAGTTTDSTLTLASNLGSSEAGASIVTLAGIPRGAFGPPSAPIESSPIESSPIESSPIESSPIESSPIESSPIESSPIESSPIESSPIESSPIESSGFTSANLQQNGLGGIPLSDLPLLHGKTWSGVLGKNVPEQSTTLADALALSPRPAGLNTLTVGDIDWAHSNSPLASLGVGAFAVGPAKLANLPPNGDPSTALADWCATIDALQGFSCSNPASLANTTVMDIALEGVPIESSGLGTVPIESSDLAGTPIESSPIESSNLVGTPIESSALSAIDLSVSPFGDIPLAAVLNPALGSPLRDLPLSSVPAGILTCVGSACGTKLGDATVSPNAKVRDLGAALNTFTVGDLKTYPGVTFGNIGRGLPADINLRDLLRALFDTVPFDPETLPLDGIQTVADAGGLVTYTATLTLQGSLGGAFAQLRAAISAGARYKPGTTVFSSGGVSLATNDPGVIDGKLAWSLNGLTYGTTYQLRFQVYPGLQLGTDTTSVTLLPLASPPKSATPVNVAVTDTLEGAGGNNTPATATPVLPGKLYISFEQTQTDTDWYSLPVPAAGSVTTFTLSHLTNDKDIVVYAPASAPLRSAPIESSPIESSPIESSPLLDPKPTLQHETDQLQPAAVQDIPIESSQLGTRVVAGVSDNPGTNIDSVAVVSSGAPAGSSYLIHVISSDPTPTNDPYVLHIDQEQPALPAACPTTRTFPFPGGGTAGTLPNFGAVPAATKTVFLVDYKRYGDTYGAAALATLRTSLTAFAARADIGGVVLPVEGSAAVQTAYNQWDTGGRSCSPESANAVVRAIISNIVDPFRAGHLNVKFLVIVGGDDLIPFPRVPDNTTTANESGYVATIGYPKDALGNAVPTNNELVGTAASSYMQTDDPWSAFNPAPLLNAPLYLPQWATGRLVETPAQIVGQLTGYGTGTINPTTQLTAGYGFLADSSAAVAQSLKTFAPGGPGDLISSTWSHADLLARLQRGNATSPQIVSINAHYDHHRALPGNEDQNDLFDSTDLTTPLNAELGRLIFSIGCHSGYAVPNFLYTSPFSLDWPEADFGAGAIARVANTTYGYGDTEVIGYSESVEVAFASRLSQMTLGEALLYAKQQYVADLGSVGPFEQKAVNALTFYGLPMRQIGTPGGPVAPPTPPATTTDPITGLQSLAINSLVTFGGPVTAANGFYFTGPDGVDATNGRPYEPRKIVRDITQPGTIPHDFLLTGLGLDAPRTHFQAARSRAIPDSAGHTPPLSSQVGWPSSVSRIGSFASPTGPRQQLVLIHGQFLSDDDADTTGTGTQTNFNRIAGNVLYSSSKDAIPPQLAKIRVTSVGSTVAFELDATDAISTSDNPPTGTVKAVVVVYYEPGASTAKTILLSQTPGTNHWSGGGPLSSASSQEINYVIQAVDLAGNVGLSVHKVVAAPVVLQQPQNGHVVITPSGASAGGGWFGGNVSVTITPDPGFTASYSVDGGAVTKYTAPFLVKGDGIHLVDAVAENAAGDEGQASAAIGIDSQAPAISILSPVDGQYALVGQSLKALYSCLDSGIGLAATDGCVGTVPVGANVDTTVGPKTFTVTARDALGHVRTMSVSYRVWRSPGEAFTALIDKTLLYLKKAPLGTTLKAALTQAANQVAANNKPAACLTLNVYIAAVKLASTSVLTAAQKADLVADATRIKTLIGCTT